MRDRSAACNVDRAARHLNAAQPLRQLTHLTRVWALQTPAAGCNRPPPWWQFVQYRDPAVPIGGGGSTALLTRTPWVGYRCSHAYVSGPAADPAHSSPAPGACRPRTKEIRPRRRTGPHTWVRPMTISGRGACAGRARDTRSPSRLRVSPDLQPGHAHVALPIGNIADTADRARVRARTGLGAGEPGAIRRIGSRPPSPSA